MEDGNNSFVTMLEDPHSGEDLYPYIQINIQLNEAATKLKSMHLQMTFPHKHHVPSM